MKTEEIYKPIKGYELAYAVSNLGNVKSFRKPHRRCEKILKPVDIGGKVSGYSVVDLGDGKKIVRHLLHRLVAVTFLDNPENKTQVNHKNGIKKDNRLENLEWNTRSENQLHSIATGLRSTVGIKNSQCKLSNEDVLKIFNDKRTYSITSKEYGVSISTISDIKRGYSWSHVTGLENIKKKK